MGPMVPDGQDEFRGDSATASAATIHGYTTVFWWSAGVFAAGAIMRPLL